MKFVTEKYCTRRGSYEKYVPGYIDKETVYYQNLFIEYRLFGLILIYRYVYHSEVIPAYAMQQFMSLGSTDWVSPHKDIINRHTEIVNKQKK